MKQDYPSILHHKYSLEDGHVTAQITGVDGYNGVMMTNSEEEKRIESAFSSVLSLEAIHQDPKLLKKYNVVGVHIHHGSLTPQFEFLKKQYGIPLFVGFRGKDATAFPKKKENLKQLKKLFRTGDRFFPVCKHLKAEIIRLGCPKHKIRVLYGGVDIERFECRPRKIDKKKKIRFLAIGRFVEKKGFSELIRAFAAVKKRHINVKLVIVGEGRYELVYRKLIKSLQLGRSVQIVPWVDYREIQSKYYRSHIFCAPSRTDQNGNQEGIPNTLKEAMATGMPVVSTTHAGIPELVKNKVSGLLVPEGSVTKLAKAMSWLVEHPESWAELGQNARKKIETSFNMELQLKKQKEFYDEVILNNQTILGKQNKKKAVNSI